MRLRPLLFLALAPLLAQGCGHSPPTTFFTLDPGAPSPSTPAPYSGPPTAVEAMHFPAALDRLEVAEEISPEEIKVHDFSRWSAALGLLGLSALSVDLAARLPAGMIVYPRAPIPASARRLVVDVLSLNTRGGTATMDVSWSLLDPGARTSTFIAPHFSRVEVPSAGQGPRAVATNLAHLIGRLSDQIAEGLST